MRPSLSPLERDPLERPNHSLIPDSRLAVAVFSLGDHRRRLLGTSADLPPDYFDAEGRSPETDKLRTGVRLSLEDEVAKYFRDNIGQVAIFDANVSGSWRADDKRARDSL